MEPIYCEIKYSGPAAWLIAGVCFATLALAWATPFPLAVQVALSLWIVLAGVESTRRIAWRRGPRAACALFLQPGGEIGVQGAKGGWRSGVLRDGSFVAPWLTIVRWRPDGARFDRTVLLLPGMIDDRSFRHLRVLLRWR